MNRSKSPWVFLVCAGLCLLSAESLFAERSLSRSKLERELKHLRESLHEAHRELAIKVERIEELSRELDRISRETSERGRDENTPGKSAKKTSPPSSLPRPAEEPKKAAPVQKVSGSGGKEVKKKSKRPAEKSGAEFITIHYDQNSAVNFEGRERARLFMTGEIEKNPGLRVALTAFANDSDYRETDQDIADNRARFLADYLVIRGIPREVFADVVGKVSSGTGQEGRKVIISVIAGE